MDRRQLLLGMTAVGLAGQFNLSDLLNAQSIDAANQTSRAKRIYPPDVERNEPRGPIKKCVEETSAFGGSVMTHTTEYSPDGKAISWRMERDGRLIYSSADRVHTEVRDAQGLLVKSASGDRGGASQEYFYTYDGAGRMLTATNSENSDRTEYRYGSDGFMTSVQTFDPKTIEQVRNAAFDGSAWDAVNSGFGVPTGGQVIVSYDKNNNGTEMRVLAADGQLVTQIVRKYDADSQLLEEKPLKQNMAFLMLDRMPPEQRAGVTPEWIEALNKSMAGKKPSQTTYAYDTQGRFIKKLERNMFFEQTKTIRYNDYGDKIVEHTTFKENLAIPIGVPQSFDEQGNLVPTAAPEPPERSYLPPDSETRYSYRYDSHGNWTERIETQADGSSTTTRRELTYY
jgi:hypothetical protein